MVNDGLSYLKAYSQRKLGNLKNPYRVYEIVLDDMTEKGLVLIININSLDYLIIKSKLNSINLLQEEDIPKQYIEMLKREKL